jgi:hypothetical protein
VRLDGHESLVIDSEFNEASTIKEEEKVGTCRSHNRKPEEDNVSLPRVFECVLY